MYFKSKDSSLIVIDITVVRSAKDSNNCWKFSWPIPLMQLITSHLHFMASYDTQEVILF